MPRGLSLGKWERMLGEISPRAQESLSLLQGEEGTGSHQGRHRADKHGWIRRLLQEEQPLSEERYSALHRGKQAAASFTFTLSSGPHGKALLALAAV